MALIGDFLRALGQLSDRRFLWVVIKSLLLTLALLVATGALAAWSVTLLPDPLFTLPGIGPVGAPTLGLQGLAIGGLILASSFLMFPVAAIFVSMFLDEIADAVEARHYPGLGPTRRPGLIEGAATGLGFALVVIGANLAALIFYVAVPPLAPFIFLGLNGYLLGREYVQLVALRHHGPVEARALRRRNWLRSWLAGILMAVPLTVPVLNILVPVLGVATITHQVRRLAA